MRHLDDWHGQVLEFVNGLTDESLSLARGICMGLATREPPTRETVPYLYAAWQGYANADSEYRPNWADYVVLTDGFPQWASDSAPWWMDRPARGVLALPVGSIMRGRIVNEMFVPDGRRSCCRVTCGSLWTLICRSMSARLAGRRLSTL